MLHDSPIFVDAVGEDDTVQVLRISKVWQLVPPMYAAAPFLPLFDDQGTGDHLSGRDFARLFLLLCALQSIVTFTLHVAELLVNTGRDEGMWRRASHHGGGRRSSNALVVLLTSYQSLTLFCLKPFAHWVYSLSFFIDIYNGVWFLRATDSVLDHYYNAVNRARIMARVSTIQRCPACSIWASTDAGGLDRRLA